MYRSAGQMVAPYHYGAFIPIHCAMRPTWIHTKMASDLKVLILAGRDDVHATTVEGHLSSMGAVVDFFRFEQFVNAKITYRIGQSTVECAVHPEGSNLADLRSYQSIWYRRPGRVQGTPYAEQWITRMIESEARSSLDGMLQSLPCMWVNHPNKDAACQQKLWQLEVAQLSGFSIPPSIVTNRPEVVREFYDACDREVIYKMVSEQSNANVPLYEMPRGIATLPLRDADMQHLHQVEKAPHFFQQRINKQFDLRVTIIGKKIFAARIDSQSGKGTLDWRHDYSVAMDPYDLPDEVANSSMELMRRLGLNFGAVDLCVDTEGRHYFFEINCAGQYLWLEERAKFPLSLEMAKLLAGKSEPLVGANAKD
jgi:hypothetical protein